MPNRSVSGERDRHTFFDVMKQLRFLNTHCAISVVPSPVVPVWYERPWCGVPVVQIVVRRPVMLKARYRQCDSRRAWFR